LPTLLQEECDEVTVLAVRLALGSPLPSKIHRNVITSCFVLVCAISTTRLWTWCFWAWF
jgi:hypothetical protein